MGKKGGSEQDRAAAKAAKAAARQAQAKENYHRLLDAGFSSKEAGRYRYSKPEKIAQAIKDRALPAIQTAKQGRAKDKAAAAARAAESAVIAAKKAAERAAAAAKKAVGTDRQARARANYRRLIDAGFSSKEAARFRYSNPEKIAAAIKDRTLPAIQPKKQTRKRVDVETVKYKSSQLKKIKFETSESDPHHKRIWDEIRRAKQGHYSYFSITVTLDMPDGRKHSFTTNMESLKDYRNMDDVMDLIDAAIEYFASKYGEIDAVGMGVEISLNCWKAAA